MRGEQGPRLAAVVVPLVAGTEPAMLFVRRARHLRRNAGQIGFPGGLADAGDDADLRRTALREFEELVVHGGFRGLSLRPFMIGEPATHPAYEPFLERCSELGVPQRRSPHQPYAGSDSRPTR